MNQIKSRHLVALALCLVLTIVFLIYRPALDGPFVFDDAPNIVQNKALHLSSLDPKDIRYALENVRAGPFGRPVAYASFALNHYFFGSDAYSFKLINLIIHLLNGICVFLLTRLLLRAFRFTRRAKLEKQRIGWMALATATLWLLHPLALTSVLYVVQRMNSLAALFSFLAFIFYFAGRLKQFTGRSGLLDFAMAFGIFAPLAVLSKDNAILIPYLLLVADWLLLGLKTRSKGGRIVTFGLLSGAIVPLFAALSIRDDILRSLLVGYARQPFTLLERLLTESRVLWFYLKLIFIPQPADLGLYHDDIGISKGLFQPITTFFSAAGLLILGLVAWVSRNTAPMVSFAILFFLIGHSIESSIFSLEIAHEHRNYLPMFGLVLMLVYYALHPCTTRLGGRKVIAGITVLAILFASLTINRASDWKDIGSLSLSLAQHHPHSARSNYEAGRLFVEMIEDDIESPDTANYDSLARRYFTASYRSDASNPAGLFGILYLDGLLGKPIDRQAVAILERRLAEYPILPATSLSFSSVYNCYEKRSCHIDARILARLYESALTNPRSGKKTRASLLNELALLNLESRKPDRTIAMLKKSVALNPKQPQLRFNLVLILINAGRLEEAELELKTIREKFPNVQEENKLANLEKMFAKASGISIY